LFNKFNLKIIVLYLLLSLSSVAILNADIFKFKKIVDTQNSFFFKRDIFTIKERVEHIRINPVRIIKEDNIPVKKKKTDIESELKSSIRYEGSLKRNGRMLALINVEGEFYIVEKGDVVLKKIKIIDIVKDKIIVSTDSEKVDILKKGETDE